MRKRSWSSKRISLCSKVRGKTQSVHHGGAAADMHTAIEDLWSKRTQYQDFSKQQCLLAWCAHLDADDEKKGEVQGESQHPPEAGGKVSGLIEGGAAAAAFPGTEMQEKQMDEDVDDALGMDGNRLGAPVTALHKLGEESTISPPSGAAEQRKDVSDASL